MRGPKIARIFEDDPLARRRQYVGDEAQSDLRSLDDDDVSRRDRDPAKLPDVLRDGIPKIRQSERWSIVEAVPESTKVAARERFPNREREYGPVGTSHPKRSAPSGIKLESARKR